MDDGELEVLLRDLESDRVERTTSATDRGKACQAICAFANDLPGHCQPGVIFIGARDDGSCGQLEITDQLLLNLADVRSAGNILPIPAMTVQKRTIAGCDLAVIIVQPADAPPVRYKGRVWIRVGPRRAFASEQEERILSEKRRSRDLPFDIRPVAGARLDDLDLLAFCRLYLPSAVGADALQENGRSPEQQLSSLRFATTGPDPVPTALGILVVGSDPRRFFPGGYVQFRRVDGTDLTDPTKDQREISGPLVDLLPALDQTLQVNVTTPSDLTGGPVEIRHPDYPLSALQQLARNAVLHRTYEGTNAPVRITWLGDRVEILSPGGPYGLVSLQNFGQPGITDYRNPHLAEAMRNLGYVQRFGFGIPLARRELERNGNPPA